jgi:hypothetical protein
MNEIYHHILSDDRPTIVVKFDLNLTVHRLRYGKWIETGRFVSNEHPAHFREFALRNGIAVEKYSWEDYAYTHTIHDQSGIELFFDGSDEDVIFYCFKHDLIL